MSFIVLANFKSHKTSSEVETWLQTVAPAVDATKTKVSLLFAPSTIHLAQSASHLTHHKSPIALCAQDVSPFPPGAYTGEVNALQLKEYGVTYALIGHSERRRYFHETPQDVANKARELISAGITPALCLAKADIVPQFAALDDNLQSRCLYCFEPPADIGGTNTAPLDVITDTIEMIKRYVTAPVLYGGSVTPDNITSLLSLNLGGVLVSTASLDPTQLSSILTQVSSHAR